MREGKLNSAEFGSRNRDTDTEGIVVYDVSDCYRPVVAGDRRPVQAEHAAGVDRAHRARRRSDPRSALRLTIHGNLKTTPVQSSAFDSAVTSRESRERNTSHPSNISSLLFL